MQELGVGDPVGQPVQVDVPQRPGDETTGARSLDSDRRGSVLGQILRSTTVRRPKVKADHRGRRGNRISARLGVGSRAEPPHRHINHHTSTTNVEQEGGGLTLIMEVEP